MRIATWNVNGLRARLDFVRHWLEARRPDLVALQELKLEDDQFPHDELAALGYRAVAHGQKAWNGVAVLVRGDLARGDLVEVRQGLPGMEEQGARLVTVEAGGVRFTSVYCPNGKSVDHPDYAAKLAWFDALAEHLESALSRGVAAVVGGDFNVCPRPIDSWNEERLAGSVFHTAAERQRIDRLLALGLTDLFRAAHPERRAFSWWDYRGGAFHRGMGLRIDFLLATRAVVERLEAVEIDREYRKKKDGLTASDHAPVMADLAD